MSAPQPLTGDELATIKARWGGRLVCPTHGIPDCSVLLNGCTVPKYLHRGAEDVSRLVAEVERLREWEDPDSIRTLLKMVDDDDSPEASAYVIAALKHYRGRARAAEAEVERLQAALDDECARRDEEYAARNERP